MHWKTSALVINKFLSLFVNTLAVNDKHYLLNRGNLQQPIQMQLCQKQKKFSEFFFSFLKSWWNFKHLTKKHDPRRWSVSWSTSSEKYGYINVQNAGFQKTLRQTTRQIGPNTFPMWMAKPLQYLLSTLEAVALEKVSFSDAQNPKAVC